MRHLILFVLFLSFTCFTSTAARAEIKIQTVAKQAMIVDMETGSVIFNKNADERMPTSSMSKVMTAMVVFDAVKDGRLKLEDKLKVSTKAWK